MCGEPQEYFGTIAVSLSLLMTYPHGKSFSVSSRRLRGRGNIVDELLSILISVTLKELVGWFAANGLIVDRDKITSTYFTLSRTVCEPSTIETRIFV